MSMNFNNNNNSKPTVQPKKNHTKTIIGIIITAVIVIAITGFFINMAMRVNDNWNQTFNSEPTTEQTMLHKCNNLQQYYGEVGLNVNLKCDRLVNALVD